MFLILNQLKNKVPIKYTVLIGTYLYILFNFSNDQ